MNCFLNKKHIICTYIEHVKYSKKNSKKKKKKREKIKIKKYLRVKRLYLADRIEKRKAGSRVPG